jgi:hypothetical protein
VKITMTFSFSLEDCRAIAESLGKEGLPDYEDLGDFVSVAVSREIEGLNVTHADADQ